MGANTDPQSMQAAVDQLDAAKKSRQERKGANQRREAQPSSQGPKTFDALIAGLQAATRNRKEQQAAERRPLSEPTRVDAPPPRDDYFSPDRFAAMGGDLNALAQMQDKVKGGWRPDAPSPTPARNDYFDRDRFAAMGGDLNALAEVEGKMNTERPNAPSPTPAKNDYFDSNRFNELIAGLEASKRKNDEERATLPYFPGKPPEKPMPGKRPVEEHPWGREDDPNYGRKKSIWHHKKRAAERREHELRRALKRRRGGIDFGPGRGSRINRNVPRPEMETGFNTSTGFNAGLPGGDFINPEEATRGREYLDFMKRLMRQKQGQFDR